MQMERILIAPRGRGRWKYFTASAIYDDPELTEIFVHKGALKKFARFVAFERLQHRGLR